MVCHVIGFEEKVKKPERFKSFTTYQLSKCPLLVCSVLNCSLTTSKGDSFIALYALGVFLESKMLTKEQKLKFEEWWNWEEIPTTIFKDRQEQKKFYAWRQYRRIKLDIPTPTKVAHKPKPPKPTKPPDPPSQKSLNEIHKASQNCNVSDISDEAITPQAMLKTIKKVAIKNIEDPRFMKYGVEICKKEVPEWKEINAAHMTPDLYLKVIVEAFCKTQKMFESYEEHYKGMEVKHDAIEA